MRMLLLAIGLTLVTPAMASGVHCANFQSTAGLIKRPAPPDCMDRPFAVTGELSFDSCRADVKLYLNDVDNYLQCLNEEGNEVVDERNRLVDTFNCHIGGAVCH